MTRKETESYIEVFYSNDEYTTTEVVEGKFFIYKSLKTNLPIGFKYFKQEGDKILFKTS